MKISVVSGGFDPIHSGHISYLKSAKKIGDYLIVALNSDEWLINKKKKVFMPLEERKNILINISFVDEVITFKDDEKGSCINALLEIKNKYPDDEIVFCNGGDRNKGNVPEMIVDNIDFEFSVGGKKKLNSSSWLLKKLPHGTSVVHYSHILQYFHHILYLHKKHRILALDHW